MQKHTVDLQFWALPAVFVEVLDKEKHNNDYLLCLRCTIVKLINMLKSLKRIEIIVQNFYYNSCYLIDYKHILQKFFFVLSDVSLCLLGLFLSPWTNVRYLKVSVK
jgi:hypothetical protein